MNTNTRRILVVVIAILSIAIVGVTAFAGFLILNHQGQQQATPIPLVVNGSNTPGPIPTFSRSPVATGMLSVRGSQIMHRSGHPSALLWAQMHTPLYVHKHGES